MKGIPGFENLYSITFNGKIWSHRKNKFLKLGYCKGGYQKIYLYPNFKYGESSIKINGRYKRKRKTYTIHRLVAMVYLKNYNKKLEVNHKDFNKQNNHVNNLEMTTFLQNMKHYRTKKHAKRI